MQRDNPGTPDDMKTKLLYHGTRTKLKQGDLIEPGVPQEIGKRDIRVNYVFLTPDLDAAIWESEIAIGEAPGKVYTVEPLGPIKSASDLTDWKPPAHPSMTYCSSEPLQITGEITEWPLYHGTRADLKPGDLIQPGQTPNFGNRDRTTTYVYLTRTLDAATWGAELADGEGHCKIYIVEPTGPVEDDPNLTDKKFRGNPTKSFRSRKPLRVIGEVTDWQGHSPEAIKSMKDSLKRLEQAGIEPIDD